MQDMDTVTFAPNTVIFSKNDPGNMAYLVKSGRVEIFCERECGEVSIGEAHPGEVFGEMALIDEHPRMANARTVEQTVCYVIPPKVFHLELDRSSDFLKSMILVFMNRIRQLGDLVQHDCFTEETEQQFVEVAATPHPFLTAESWKKPLRSSQ